MPKYKLLIKNIQQIIQVCENYETMKYGENAGKVAVKKAANLFLTVDNNGNIFDISEKNSFNEDDFERVIDANGCCMIPGLIDAHTHPVWAGDRVNEFAMKLAGCSYMDIHEAGGGIHFTVRHTREATEDELYQSFIKRLQSMIKQGTTLVECKSGYGLDYETELKMLRVIERAKKDDNILIDISSTYCGAHAVPENKTAQEATNDILQNQIPLLKKEILEGRLDVDNIDVFCEKGVFNCEQTRQILEAGKEIGLQINFHADELSPLGGAELGAELGAVGISHLEEISINGIKEMSKSKSVAIILPTTAYILRLKNPPVRDMIQSGVPVALGSDFNPNAYCLSMVKKSTLKFETILIYKQPTVMHLACVLFRMSLPEVLIASTINAAASLGKSKTHGSIEIGKRANLILLQSDR